MTHDREIPLGEEGADRALDRVEDDVARNLTKVCLAAARMRFVRSPDLSDEAWEAQLPKAPFDMAFFVAILIDVFSRTDVIERILRGESIASATGWDV